MIQSVTRYPPPAIRHPSPATRHPLPVTCYPSPTTRHPLPATRYPPSATRYPLPATRYPLPATRYPLPVEKCWRTWPCWLARILNTNRRSRQKNPELLPESCKLNGNIFFKLFLGDLVEKMTSAGFKRDRTKNRSETVWRADNLFNLGLRHVQVIKDNTVILQDNSSLRNQERIPNCFPYPYKCPE